ncbi:unnamed protein product [Prunus armeniaca]|uniref:CCR4-NOT transcription complex subunit 9 n=1 Tax=Prunus armeniaca TaxID=36596 RepID=A0A6J5UN89_PRUAR|nr:unnamed protein product [Prunus armeniaca]
MSAPFGDPIASNSSAAGAQPNKEPKMASAEQLVLELSNPDLRENALLELSKLEPVLCFWIWNSIVVAESISHMRDVRPCIASWASPPVSNWFWVGCSSSVMYLSGPTATHAPVSIDICVTLHLRVCVESINRRRENYFKIWLHCCWNSFGTIAALQEIVSIYPVLSPPNLTPAQSNRVCNALALLQCVASHPDTRMLFLNGNNLYFVYIRRLQISFLVCCSYTLILYPFLNTTSKSRPFEYLRLTSLGVIGALVKVDDTEVISFLLSTEIIPLCLRTMEMGGHIYCSKDLLDDVGLDYICTTAERFFAVGRVLGTMVASLAEQHSSRLLKHIIRCYLRLSDNARACDALRSCLPEALRDATFSGCLREDPTTRRWLQQLLHNVAVSRVPALQAGGGFDHMMVN